MSKIINAAICTSLLALGIACTDRHQSGDGSSGTGVNTGEQTRFDGSDRRTMASVSDQVAGEEPVTKEQVKQVQEALNKRGAKLAVNGLESAETSRAVERFQSETGLAPTGRIDHAVLEKLGIKSDRVPASVPDRLNEGS